jgi:hypothetical protein
MNEKITERLSCVRSFPNVEPRTSNVELRAPDFPAATVAKRSQISKKAVSKSKVCEKSVKLRSLQANYNFRPIVQITLLQVQTV